MSYAQAAALQEAIFQTISNDAAVTALVGTDVYDALPSGPLPALYVTLGAERVRDASDATGAGAWHDLNISVVSEAAGFLTAKQTTEAISDALAGAHMTLRRGHLISLAFVRARATRETAGRRRIDLTFRARVQDI